MRQLMFHAKHEVLRHSTTADVTSPEGHVHFDTDSKESSRKQAVEDAVAQRLELRKAQANTLHDSSRSQPGESRRRKGRMPSLPPQKVDRQHPLQVAFGAGTTAGSFSARDASQKEVLTLPPIGKNGLMPTAPRSTLADGGDGGRTYGRKERTMYDTLGCLTWRQTHSKQLTGGASGSSGQAGKPRAWVVDTVNLANNALEHLDGVGQALRPFLVFHNLLTLQVLDISCNRLVRLWNKPATVELSSRHQQAAEPDELAQIPNLHTLHLHGNMLHDPRDLEVLHKLKVLRKLSLHGNPIAEQKHPPIGYRLAVLRAIPWLKELDFAGITKDDRIRLRSFRPKRCAYDTLLGTALLSYPNPDKEFTRPQTIRDSDDNKSGQLIN